MKAKTVSLIAKITAGVILLGGAALKWTGVFLECDIDDVCKVALTLMGLFGTVDLNIALDKFRTRKDEEE